MPYRIFEIRSTDRPLLEKALQDDTLSRQSLQVKEARAYGVPRDSILLVVEGTEAGLLRADALILEFGRRLPESEEVYSKIKKEEEDAAAGVGFIFGP